MTKKSLLETLDGSILKNIVSTQRLHEKYYGLIQEALEDYSDKTKIALANSDRVFGSKSRFDNFLRSNRADVIEEALRNLLKELRFLKIGQCDANGVPSASAQRAMRLSVTGRIDKLVARMKGDLQETDREALIAQLMEARNVLSELIFPKNDARVVLCYDTMMDLIDGILLGLQEGRTEAAFCARILATSNEWSSLSRG